MYLDRGDQQIRIMRPLCIHFVINDNLVFHLGVHIPGVPKVTVRKFSNFNRLQTQPVTGAKPVAVWFR
jgi:hypothetical protein